MRLNVYLNKELEEKLNKICKNFKSRSECIKRMIMEYENCAALDELMLELQSIEEKLDYIKQRIDGPNHLNRV
ncbi:MAG: ribbon-helix-helix domain-containing protein [Candidatus Nanopusillus sp.]|jgi:metal-responsive CopG/Arc/MetJ family transcriptional regulator|nr:ribbon-helix-helix domain-containing protein [Candidatus Nanopusillus sp.]MCG2868849.1 ribbon-helix-helix domain-containing protein [Candidatus Nanopusillus sp.]